MVRRDVPSCSGRERTGAHEGGVSRQPVEAIALILEDQRERGTMATGKRLIHPIDTSPEAQSARIEEFRSMTPTQKLRRVGMLNEALKVLQKARIRAEYGDISDEEMRMRLGALRLGRETMIKVFGWDPDEKGW